MGAQFRGARRRAAMRSQYRNDEIGPSKYRLPVATRRSVQERNPCGRLTPRRDTQGIGPHARADNTQAERHLRRHRGARDAAEAAASASRRRWTAESFWAADIVSAEERSMRPAAFAVRWRRAIPDWQRITDRECRTLNRAAGLYQTLLQSWARHRFENERREVGAEAGGRSPRQRLRPSRGSRCRPSGCRR